MDELRNPITFQCTACNMIVTDSFFLLERVEDSLLFSTAPNTSLDKKVVRTDSTGLSTSCSYYPVQCLCGKEIGRKYITVDKQLTNCLNKYLIKIESIRGYQLGNRIQQTESAVMTNSEINTEIVKLQRFCTFLYSKIKEIR